MFQITNQMVLSCKDYLRECTLKGENDLLWNKVQEEVDTRDENTPQQTGPHLDAAQRAHIQAQLDARLQVR